MLIKINDLEERLLET
jgi:hypothetical protein